MPRSIVPLDYHQRLAAVTEEIEKRKRGSGLSFNKAQLSFDLRYHPGLIGYLLAGKHIDDRMLTLLETWLDDPSMARRHAFERCGINPDAAVASEEKYLAAVGS